MVYLRHVLDDLLDLRLHALALALRDALLRGCSGSELLVVVGTLSGHMQSRMVPLGYSGKNLMLSCSRSVMHCQGGVPRDSLCLRPILARHRIHLDSNSYKEVN